MLYVKAAHVVMIISWMAALLYLPRLLVYHADAPVGSAQSETFKVMERRLLRGIAGPAMAGTWIFGWWMAYLIGAWHDLWFWAKVVLVIGLSAFHGFIARQVRAFASDDRTRDARFFRMINEIPAVIMIGIVVLVIVKPF